MGLRTARRGDVMLSFFFAGGASFCVVVVSCFVCCICYFLGVFPAFSFSIMSGARDETRTFIEHENRTWVRKPDG